MLKNPSNAENYARIVDEYLSLSHVVKECHGDGMVSQLVWTCFYVDDYLDSVDDEELAVQSVSAYRRCSSKEVSVLLSGSLPVGGPWCPSKPKRGLSHHT